MFQLQSHAPGQHIDSLPLPAASELPSTSRDDSSSKNIVLQEGCERTEDISNNDFKLQVEQENFQRALLNNLSSPPAPPSPKPTSALSVSSYFSKAESSNDDSSKQEGSLSAPAFRTEVEPHQVASAVNSFRALKVTNMSLPSGALSFPMMKLDSVCLCFLWLH